MNPKLSNPRLFLISAILLSLVGLSSNLWSDSPASQGSPQEQMRIPEISTPKIENMVDVGGRKLHSCVYGHGSPTVVLVSGLGAPQEYWNSVIPDLAAETTVVTYDRAGIGQSEIGDRPTHGVQSAKDLQVLLDKLGVPRPYILVGHSYGGSVVRLFASMDPADMGGLILEDTQHEDVLNEMRKILKGKDLEAFDQVLADRFSVPENPRTEDDYRNMTREQVRQSQPLPRIPFVILTSAGRAKAMGPMFSPEALEEMAILDLALNNKLAALIPGGKQIIVEGTGHNIHLDKPEALMAPVVEMIKEVREKDQDVQPVQSPAKTGYLEVPDGRLYYEVGGEGDWLVLVHDGNLHSVTYDEQFPVFSKNYKVVRYDRRGYGKSTYPEKPYSNIEDLAEVFRQLKIDQATLMGMSAGGELVIDFTLEHPDKVTGLVLVGAVVSGLGYSDHMMTRGGHLDPKILSDPAKLADYMCHRDPYTFYEGNKEAKKRGYEYLMNNLQNYKFDKFTFLKGPARPALPNLKEIKVPTLIIVGEFDIPDCHAHAGAMEAGIAGSKRVIINKAGHIVPLEQPAVFNEIALTFLRENKFFEILGQKGVFEAVQAFEKARQKEDHSLYFSEQRLNQAGYGYLQAGKIKEAIELFKLNVLAYPDSWNTYDSLAEAYMAEGHKAQAVFYYEKSLQLNPGNVNAVNQLKNLKK